MRVGGGDGNRALGKDLVCRADDYDLDNGEEPCGNPGVAGPDREHWAYSAIRRAPGAF